MANRPAGGARSKVYPRDPLDWYREPPWLVDQMFEHIDFPNCVIYDPCCGGGNMLDGAKRAGYQTMGSDLVRRNARHPFAITDIFKVRNIPVPKGYRLGVACNPPYGYEERICERIISHVLGLPNLAKAVFVVPISFLAAQERFEFFTRAKKPFAIHTCSERPTMPGGAQVADFGDDAYKGAMADYIWLEYRPGHQGPTEHKWMRPRTIA